MNAERHIRPGGPPPIQGYFGYGRRANRIHCLPVSRIRIKRLLKLRNLVEGDFSHLCLQPGNGGGHTGILATRRAETQTLSPGTLMSVLLNPQRPALVLAPMDGITDAPMRALQGESGAFTYAVTEFLRVNATPIPAKVFLREVPELANDAKTASGMSVQVQILGGDPEQMAL